MTIKRVAGGRDMLVDANLIRDALTMIADPTLKGRSWGDVKKALRLDPDASVDGDRFCTVMYSCWLFARMAEAVLAGDGDGLSALMDQHDSDRAIRARTPT